MCPQEPISQKKRILLSWSSGKDSAWCLHVLRKNRDYEIVGLLTTFNESANRVTMHAARRELVEHQAFAASLPLWPVHLPWPCSNEQYDALMAEACNKAIGNGIEGIAFGDLFLEDVRAYREKQLKGTGLEPLFPLWGQPTRELARAMIRSGLRAKLTCIDTNQLDAEFLGREFDEDLLAALPASVDRCGEKGEFHSFVYAGPMFDLEMPVVIGETVVRDQFVFADLTSASTGLALSPKGTDEGIRGRTTTQICLALPFGPQRL
jgi:uncharacterized protein (TIGR00290 family)